MKWIAMMISLLFLVGCASAPTNEAEFYAAQRAWAERVQMPLVEITAQPGQEITGLQSVRVYAPSGGNQAPAMQQYQQQQHPAWSLAADALRVGLPLYLGGQAAIGLADTVGKRVGDVARDVTVVEQPPPTIVPSPDPVIVPSPDPIIVPSPDPVIVDPVIVQPPPQQE